MLQCGCPLRLLEAAEVVAHSVALLDLAAGAQGVSMREGEETVAAGLELPDEELTEALLGGSAGGTGDDERAAALLAVQVRHRLPSAALATPAAASCG